MLKQGIIIYASLVLTFLCFVDAGAQTDSSPHTPSENIIEQDHRFIKKKVRASQCFKRFHPAERTLEGIEAVNMMRKGQVKRLSEDDAVGQARFVERLFQIAA